MKTFRTEEYKNSPLYQNNPGNLPNKGEDWGGKVLKAQRKGNAKYEEFLTIEYGLRALMINIRTIMDKGGKNTIADFSRRFYPALSTKKYLLYENTLTKAFGIDNHKRITAFTKDFYIKMAKIVASIEMGAAESLIPAEAYETAFALMGTNMTSGGNTVLPAPAKPIIPTPSNPSTPAPSKPSNPIPNNGGSTNIGSGNTEGGTSGGGANLNQGKYTPIPSENNDATNWLLWGGLAVALGAGGYLFYSHYNKKKK